MKIVCLLLLLLFENEWYNARCRCLPVVPKEISGQHRIPITIKSFKQFKKIFDLFGVDLAKHLAIKNSETANNVETSERIVIEDPFMRAVRTTRREVQKPVTFPAFSIPQYVDRRPLIKIKNKESLADQDEFLRDLFLVDEEMVSSGILSEDLAFQDVNLKEFIIRRIGNEGPFILLRKDSLLNSDENVRGLLDILAKELQSTNSKLKSSNGNDGNEENKDKFKNGDHNENIEQIVISEAHSKIPRKGRKISVPPVEAKANRQNIFESVGTSKKIEIPNKNISNISKLTKQNSSLISSEKHVHKSRNNSNFVVVVVHDNHIPSNKDENMNTDEFNQSIIENNGRIKEKSRTQKIQDNVNKLKALINQNKNLAKNEKEKLISILDDKSLPVQQRLRLLHIEASSQSRRHHKNHNSTHKETDNPEQIIMERLQRLQNLPQSKKIDILQNLLKYEQVISNQKHIVLNMLKELHEKQEKFDISHNLTHTELISVSDKLELLSNTIGSYRHIMLYLITGGNIISLDLNPLLRLEVPLFLHKLLTQDLNSPAPLEQVSSISGREGRKLIKNNDHISDGKREIDSSKFHSTDPIENELTTFSEISEKTALPKTTLPTTTKILLDTTNSSPTTRETTQEIVLPPTTMSTFKTSPESSTKQSTTTLETSSQAPTSIRSTTQTTTSLKTTTPAPPPTLVFPYPPTEPPGLINKNYFPEFLLPAIETANEGILDLRGRANQGAVLASHEISNLAQHTTQQLLNALNTGTDGINDVAYDTYRGARQIQFFLEKLASNSVPFWGRLLGVAMKELLSRTANIVNSFGNFLSNLNSNIFGGLFNSGDALKVFVSDQAQAVNSTIQKTAQVIERVALNAIQQFTGFNTKNL